MTDADEFFSEDEHPANDFRRSNGAPLVRDPANPDKWLRYSRPSGFGHDLDDEEALQKWRIDRAMDGVASSPALAAKVAAVLGNKRGRKDLRDEAILLGRGGESADLGTALHAMSHRLETEQNYVAVEPFAADLARYLLTLDAAGLVSEHVEVHLCSDTWRAAGTADRIYRCTRELEIPSGGVIEPGQMVVGDLKTGEKLDYSLPGYTIQLAVYCDSVIYDIDTDQRTPLPATLRTDWGLLVHLPAGHATCNLYWVDLQVGREGARIVRDVRNWRRRQDFAYEFDYPASDEIAVLDTAVHDIEHDIIVPGVDDFDAQWVEAMLPWTQARINQIGAHPEARAMFLRRWPQSIAPIREACPAPPQMSEILGLLDLIEGAYRLPFVEGDPRTEWNRGLHKSQVDRTNQPPSRELPA